MRSSTGDENTRARLAEADERMRAGDEKGALRRLLEVLPHDPFLRDALLQTAEVTRRLGAAEESTLFSRVAADPDESQALYDLGYLLVESGLPHAGRPYLERCAELQPGHPLVRYELSYARFMGGDYRGAMELIDRLLVDDALAGPEKFAAGLLRVECLLYSGDRERARDAFEAIDVRDADRDGEQRLDAVALLLGRAAALGRPAADARDWHFLEQGGIVLHTGEDHPEAWVPSVASPAYLARLLLTLVEILDELGRTPRSVRTIGQAIAPLSRVLARIVDADVAPLGEPGVEPTLLMAREPSEIAPHTAGLRDMDGSEDLFVLTLDPRRDHVIAPEIVGQFAADLRLPWEPEGTEAGRPPADPIRSEREIERELTELRGHREGKLARYYAALRDHVVLGNAERHPARRVFTSRRIHGPEPI